MGPVERLRRLEGIIPPTVTPLSRDGSVDRKGLQRVLEFQLAQGVAGIFLLGSTGEFANLSARQRQEVVEVGVEVVQRRVPVLVGLGGEGTEAAVEFARAVERSGVDGLVSLPPRYYLYQGVEHQVCLEFYLRLLEATELPLFAYNNPRLARTWIPVETLMALAEEERFAGVKESSADFHYFQSLLQVLSGRVAVLQGSERLLLASALMGAQGGVHGLANLLAWPCQNLWQKARQFPLSQEGLEALRREQFRLIAASKLLFDHPSPLAHLKGVMERLGLCQRWVSSPFPQAQDEAIERACQGLQRLGFWEDLLRWAEEARGKAG